jgi:hypothetical protein
MIKAAARPRKQMSKTAIDNRSRARGVERAKIAGDLRHECDRAEANAILDPPPNPDFLARAKARIQAARAGS